MKKKHFYCDYLTAIKWCNNSYIMQNNIHELDPEFYMSAPVDEEGNDREFFQFLLSDCSGWDVDYLRQRFDGLFFDYSEKLGHYVLGVDHWGTSWDYVFVEIKKRKDESPEDFKTAVEIIKSKAKNFREG